MLFCFLVVFDEEQTVFTHHSNREHRHISDIYSRTTEEVHVQTRIQQ